MNKMEEMIQALKNKLNSRLTGESSSDEINFTSDLSKDLDSIQDEYNKLEKDSAEVKQTLIDYVKRGSDTKTVPVDETQPKQPRSFEEILAEVQNKK